MFNPKPSFRFEINNSPENLFAISSPTFITGGCQWFLKIYPMGNGDVHDYVSLFLSVANSNTLRTGWKRIVNMNFIIRNQSEKVLYRSLNSSDTKSLFRANRLTLGFSKTLAHSKIEEEWEKLIIEVYINVVETFDGEGGDESEKKKTVDINGFQVLDSQVNEITLKKKKKSDDVDEARAQELEERVKDLELMELGFKLDSLKTKLDEASLERKKSDDVDEARAKKLEKRIKIRWRTFP